MLLYSSLITLASCENRTPELYFNRPVINECITLIQDGATLGMMACDGKIVAIPSKLTIIKDQENVEKLKLYYEAREYGHYLCLLSKRKCKK